MDFCHYLPSNSDLHSVLFKHADDSFKRNTNPKNIYIFFCSEKFSLLCGLQKSCLEVLPFTFYKPFMHLQLFRSVEKPEGTHGS